MDWLGRYEQLQVFGFGFGFGLDFSLGLFILSKKQPSTQKRTKS
jgi:hypothetical protein